MNKYKTFSNTPQCIVVSSPSGAGKTTLVHRLLEADAQVGKTISHTTRQPRQGEVNGRDYHFVSHETFETMKQDHSFVEWASVYEHQYGTSKKAVEDVFAQGKDAVLVIEHKGALEIKKHFAQAVFILIVPPSMQELKARLTARGAGQEKDLGLRLSRAADEVQQLAWYDFLVVNDDLALAALALQHIVQASRFRLQLHRDQLLAQWSS